MPPLSDEQIISKQRVEEHGEVYTTAREVDEMVDLVAGEAHRIESRFLEPACGRGNFLAAILRRKLSVVARRYGANQLEYERNAVLAISTIYGIDILSDNATDCRERLLAIFDEQYTAFFPKNVRAECRTAVQFVLSRNIIWGDALTLFRSDGSGEPIVFSEWSPVNGSLLKRRDYTFRALLHHQSNAELPLFSDLGEDVFIPTPLKEYQLMHFTRIADAD
jgi:hypothetical protein